MTHRSHQRIPTTDQVNQSAEGSTTEARKLLRARSQVFFIAVQVAAAPLPVCSSSTLQEVVVAAAAAEVT
jgi:hypothetical protein